MRDDVKWDCGKITGPKKVSYSSEKLKRRKRGTLRGENGAPAKLREEGSRREKEVVEGKYGRIKPTEIER